MADGQAYGASERRTPHAERLEDCHRAFGMLEETKLTDGEIKKRWETFLDIQGWLVRSRSTGYAVRLVNQIPMETRKELRVLRVLVKYLLRKDLRNMPDYLRSCKMRIKECDRKLASCLSILQKENGNQE